MVGSRSTVISEPGDIVLFRHPHGLARLISLLTRSPYYHVAISVNSREVIEAVPRGVVRSNLCARQRAQITFIPPPTKEAGNAALDWAISKIGDGYDPKDLLAIALDRIFAHLRINFVHGDRFTCGEFVATAFNETGSPLFADIDPEDTVPADFARLLPVSQAKDLADIP